MDKAALTTAMKNSISEVLETMFFTPIDFLSTDGAHEQPPADEKAFSFGLNFTGPFHGAFRVRVPEPLARDVTADFLGRDPESVTTDEIGGTVMEMINMLAGNTLSQYDANQVFNLSVPEMATGNQQENEVMGNEPIRVMARTLAGCLSVSLTIAAGGHRASSMVSG